MIKGATHIEEFFFQSWWVIFFVLLCFFVYEQGLKHRNQDLKILQEQLLVLESELGSLKEEYQDLILQVNSQNDPAWIELTLMRVLGVVPEGYKKILLPDSKLKE